jgi:hypothetical protein
LKGSAYLNKSHPCVSTHAHIISFKASAAPNSRRGIMINTSSVS